MSYPARLVLLAWIVAEAVAFYFVGRWIGVFATVVLTLGTSFVGSVLLRYHGIKAIRAYAALRHEGKLPGRAVIDGAIGLIGAVALMIPGFVSDLFGLLCVLPPTRAMLRPAAVKLLETRISSAAAGDLFGRRFVRNRTGTPRADGRSGVVDGEVVDLDGTDGEPPDAAGPKSLP